jgi:hypothetical protein
MIPIVGRALHLTSNHGVEGGRSPVSEEHAPAIARHLADEDLAELRAGLERSLCAREIADSSSREVDDGLRKSLRVACAKARLQQVRAEHLVIDLKQMWTMMPAMSVMPASRSESGLSEIITACISEYYEMEGSPPR